MTKFYCTIWNPDDQVSMVYRDRKDAERRVLNVLLELDEHAVKSRDELREICDSVEWDFRILGYGIIEIDANDEDECYELYI